ncbi:MAG: GH92 family glycosyl hydrolase [Bacteroidota bacterium]
MNKPFALCLFIAFGLTLLSCNERPSPPAASDQALTNYVNTFIGTGGHGHTYPGASRPFGMMQLSPDTRLTGWDGCSGYHYSDRYIYGFSHTHLSGTGVSDYGDVLLMPTTAALLNNGADGKEGYRTRFSHENESAAPSYYQVWLDSTDIKVELTVSERSGIHQYQFPSADQQFVILDLDHRDELLDHRINILSDKTISGYRHSKAWAEKQYVFFYMTFSHPIIETQILRSEDGKIAALPIENPNNEPVYIKVGISAVDIEGAQQNLEAEVGNKNFEEVKKEAQQAWEKELQKIAIKSNNRDHKVNFYSAMYHSMLAPNIYQDVDGRYRGMDLAIHQTKDFDYYTVFSLWDTHRAAHPLFTIIDQKRTNDFINTFIAKYEEGGIMPIWDLAGNYTHCMIGYHAVPVIADAYQKGIRDYDSQKAFEAMKHSATRDQLGLKSYKTLGYIPVEEEAESVSKTLEYAYDDWTIALMAKSLGKEDDYKNYLQRAQHYKNVFDPQSKFMRGRFRNTWFAPFDPYEVNFNYTEANAWQYSFYVPQDVKGFIELMGGKEALEKQMDELFTAKTTTSGRDQKDITGLIGQYAHGNEPSHHIAYLYNFINQPHKTQQRVHEILTTLYTNTPDGISGNEDCGQMSAWYILSSLGFYPVAPGNNQYIIGTPLFEEASIQLENGKRFDILAQNWSPNNFYIQSARLNGQSYPYSYLKHEDIAKGGQLELTMGSSPSTWGTDDQHIPMTAIDQYLITPAPYIEQGDIAFKNSTTIHLSCVDPEASIFYRIDDRDFMPYEKPLAIVEPLRLSSYTEKAGVKSATISTELYKIDPNISLALATAYANQYNAGGDQALIDGIRGTLDFRTGTWQGYWDTDVEATVNLGKTKKIQSVEVNFLQDQKSWIFSPTEVACLASKDGQSFQTLQSYPFDASQADEGSKIKTVSFDVQSDYQYIKIVAKKLGDLPEWHIGHQHDGKSWIFVDEIVVR